jgi:hypothetical protein
MKDFFADYGALVSPILAIVNGLIALVVAQFFKERPAAKIFLVASAAVLSVAAVTATVVSQRQALAIKVASDARHKEIREQLGKFIADGAQITSDCSDNSTPPNWRALAEWVSKVSEYLKAQLGQSYAARVISAAGVPVNVACSGADEAHNKVFRVGNAINFHLEQFSSEAASWP